MTTVEPVEIQVSESLVLRGETATAGHDWVVLVHDLGEDLDGWHILRTSLLRQGLSVLAFDLRGHGGSDGKADLADIPADIAAALRHVHALGAERVFLGASGAAAAVAIALADATGVDAVFLLAPRAGRVALSRALTKLVIVAREDDEQQRTAADLRDAAGWTVVVHVSGKASGLELLRGVWSSHVIGYVETFLTDVRRTSVSSRPSVRG